MFLLQSFAGLCGALLFGVGVVGAGLASLYVDRTRKFEEVAKTSFALAALCCVGFMVVRAILTRLQLLAPKEGLVTSQNSYSTHHTIQTVAWAMGASHNPSID